MKQQKVLANLLYTLISFAFSMILLDIFGIFRPIPGILAAIALLAACYCIGRYGDFLKSK